ncbi:MAG: phage tail family protein [Clostridia bacterium]|nr:phage tail family protein [Clostridia bacterium]
MYIVLKNEFGSFEIGGGGHTSARLQEIEGIGVPAKDDTPIVFEGQPGRTIIACRDLERTITMSIDFYGDERTVEKLYRIIYKPMDIRFYLGNRRRKTHGRCIAATDITKIIYHKWQKIVLQLVCDDPYFYDFYDTAAAISANADQLPNLNENGEWFVQLPAVATLRSSKASIFNRGNTEIYPKITLANNKETDALADEAGVILTNATTGKTIKLEYQIATGELVTLDLKKRKIISSLSGNIITSISDDTVLEDFYLAVGENILSIESLNTADDIFAMAYYSNQYVSVVV